MDNTKAQDAYRKSADWLAKANRYAEKGQTEKAEACYEKSTHWLMRYNELSQDGRGA